MQLRQNGAGFHGFLLQFDAFFQHRIEQQGAIGERRVTPECDKRLALRCRKWPGAGTMCHEGRNVHCYAADRAELTTQVRQNAQPAHIDITGTAADRDDTCGSPGAAQ